MKKSISILLISLIFSHIAFSQKAKRGWYTLYDGKSFDGWRINEDSPSTFSIKDGVIKVNGPRSHVL
jgi:hypothetical protein